MKTLDELRSYFENEIKPELSDLEKWRKKVLIRSIIVDTILGPPFVFGLVYCVINLTRYAIEKQMTVSDLILASIMVLPLLYLFFDLYYIIWQSIRYFKMVKKSPGETKLSKNIRNEHKFSEVIVGKIVKFISADLEYSPDERTVSGEEVLGSEIFPHTVYYPYGYIASDFVEGKINDINVRFYEISGRDFIVDITSSGAIDVTGKSHESFPFYGMFGIYDFNKSFKGHTLVLPEKRLRQSQWMTGSGRKIVKMDDPEFERYFSVYGTDQIMARYILSTSLMKRITEYRKSIKRKIYLSFTRNKLFIAIQHKKNQFEFNMYKSIYDFGQIKEFYNDMSIMTNIVEELNLNTKIWLKTGEAGKTMRDSIPEYNTRKLWIFRLLTYLFGYLGLHYLYIGYKGKALITFLITSAVFPYLIWRTYENHWQGASGFLIVLLPIVWFFVIFFKAYHIKHDCRGIEMG